MKKVWQNQTNSGSNFQTKSNISTYQLLSQFDEDHPQLTQGAEEKEEDIEFIYEDEYDSDPGGITYESDSSIDILHRKKFAPDVKAVIMAQYGNYFTEVRYFVLQLLF